MPRLVNLKSPLSRLPATVSRLGKDEAERSRQRDQDAPYRRWYKTARWQSLRWDVLTGDNFTCRMCRKIEPNTARLVCDHVEPHRGDPEKFWSGPFQTLCKDCHDGIKSSMDRRTRG